MCGMVCPRPDQRQYGWKASWVDDYCPQKVSFLSWWPIWYIWEHDSFQTTDVTFGSATISFHFSSLKEITPTDWCHNLHFSLFIHLIIYLFLRSRWKLSPAIYGEFVGANSDAKVWFGAGCWIFRFVFSDSLDSDVFNHHNSHIDGCNGCRTRFGFTSTGNELNKTQWMMASITISPIFTATSS